MRRIAAGGERYQRIGGAVDHQGRRHDGAQLPAPVAGGDAGQQLARHAGRVVGAAHAAADALAQLLARRRIAGLPITPNMSAMCSITASGFFGSAGRLSSALRAALVGFETRRLPEVDMIEVRLCTRCGNFAASTCAIMPPIEAPTTCARSSPAGPSGRWCRRPCPPAYRACAPAGPARRRPWPAAGCRASSPDPPRQAAIAVVEADHAVAARHQCLTEGIGPARKLHAEPHDQHDGRPGRVAQRLVFDVQRRGAQAR
jgi:hypothetical protein